MPFPGLLQIIILACVFTAGWAIGFYASSSERKWQRRYRDEQGFYAQYREQANRAIGEKTQRIAALDGEIAALRQSLGISAPVPEASSEPRLADMPGGPDNDASIAATAILPPPDPPLAPPVAAMADTPAPIAEAAETEPVDPRENLSQDETEMPDNDAEAGHSGSDETAPPPALTQIRGIDADLAARLQALDITTTADIEQLSAEREKAIEDRLGLAPGQIAYDQWRLQAALLGPGTRLPVAETLAEPEDARP